MNAIFLQKQGTHTCSCGLDLFLGRENLDEVSPILGSDVLVRHFHSGELAKECLVSSEGMSLDPPCSQNECRQNSDVAFFDLLLAGIVHTLILPE